VIYVA